MSDIMKAQHELVEQLADKWGLLTAGEGDHWNTMTIAWGQTGTLWWKPVVEAYVVPSRYTFGFMEDSDYFVVNLFPEEFHRDLYTLGTKSGRDCDKVAMTKLTPKPIEHGITFEEADVTIVCKKLVEQPLDPDAIPQEIKDQFYQSMGVHSLFIGEIVEVL